MAPIIIMIPFPMEPMPYPCEHAQGELEFLGIKKRRAQTVLATTYCEVASLSPNRIGTGSQIRARLSVVSTTQLCRFLRHAHMPAHLYQ